MSRFTKNQIESIFHLENSASRKIRQSKEYLEKAVSEIEKLRLLEGSGESLSSKNWDKFYELKEKKDKNEDESLLFTILTLNRKLHEIELIAQRHDKKMKK